METFVDIISDIGAQISKIKRCRINQQTLINRLIFGSMKLPNKYKLHRYTNRFPIYE